MPKSTRISQIKRSKKKPTIIAVSNEKGGSGKTAVSCNTAAGLARLNFRVLLLGLDARGPLAENFGVTAPDDLLPLADAVKQHRLDEAMIAAPKQYLWLVPGDLSFDEQALANEPMRDTMLQRALSALKRPFDYILLDTPPGLNLVTLNAIMAADKLIVPCDADRESLEAAKRTIEAALQYLQFRPDIDEKSFYRILYSMYDYRDRIINDWFQKQIRAMKLPTFTTRIHRSTNIKKARAHGLSIFDYAEKQNSRGFSIGRSADDFRSFTQELLQYVC